MYQYVTPAASAETASVQPVQRTPMMIGAGHLAAGNRALRTLLSIQREAEPGQSLDERYRAALAAAMQSGDFTQAAELLNAFNRNDILSRLAELTQEQIGYMHIGATGNPAVGPDSQVAELTAADRPLVSATGPATSQALPQTPAESGGELTDEQIAAMTPNQRLVEAFHRADINAAVREKILSLLTPDALAGALIGFAVVFVASQFTPVGWAGDIALGLTAVFIGTAVFRAAGHLIAFAEARNATTLAEITAAGNEFAQAVAEVEIDAILFLLMRTTGGAVRGGVPLDGPPASGAGVVLGTAGGQLAIVAAETIPAEVAAELGVLGAGVSLSSGGNRERNFDRKKRRSREDEFGDEGGRPRDQRISDGTKVELEDSPWLRKRLPDPDRRREFMDWLKYGHKHHNLLHDHFNPATKRLEAAVREFEAENPL